MNFIDNIKKRLIGEEKKDESTPENPDPPIIPIHYEIILIRPESRDDMDYVFDQIVEYSNPIIVDLGYFEEEDMSEFEIAIEKIKSLRQEYDAESILLCNTSDKNMILIVPSRIKITKKE
jgi:SepF-like predicted cell division protein (DUF552 family)